MVGIDILGPVNVFAGPSLQYILTMILRELPWEMLKMNLLLAHNLAQVSFGGIGVDVRYERAFKRK